MLLCQHDIMKIAFSFSRSCNPAAPLKIHLFFNPKRRNKVPTSKLLQIKYIAVNETEIINL